MLASVVLAAAELTSMARSSLSLVSLPVPLPSGLANYLTSDLYFVQHRLTYIFFFMDLFLASYCRATKISLKVKRHFVQYQGGLIPASVSSCDSLLTMTRMTFLCVRYLSYDINDIHRDSLSRQNQCCPPLQAGSLNKPFSCVDGDMLPTY